MTTLAAGQNVTITLGDGGRIAIASNGGFWAADVTRTEIGIAQNLRFGPQPVRQVLGPFSEGATVVLTAVTADLTYDAYILGNGSSDIAVGGSQQFTLPAGASLALASNAGFFVASVAPVADAPSLRQYGPTQVRTVLGPYPLGASITVTSSTAAINCNLFSPNSPAPYEANLASRTLVPNLYIAAATATWGNFRKVDYARADISGQVRVLVPNYRYNAANEVGVGSSARCRVSIEYPIGSTPQKFAFAVFSGDANNAIVGNNAQVESLPLTLNVPIPAGAKFLWHTQFECTLGVLCNQTTAYLPEDGVELSTSPLPDRTATGGTSYGTPSTGQTHSPLALIGTTISPSIAGHGNSNQLGAIQLVTSTFPASDAFGYQGLTGRSVAPSLPYMNLGSYGDTIAAFIGSAGTKRRAQMAYCSHIVTDIGINDIVINSRTAAQVYADLQTLRSLFPTKRFYAHTLAPNTTGAWTNPDGSDQVLGANEAQRAAYNALLIANSAGFDGVFQTDQAIALPGRTKWLAPGYTNEGTHYTEVAQLAVKNSGIVNPAVFTR